MVLKATDISVRFAGLSAIDRVSVALGQGEILGLVGPNGAGKTTMVNVLSGFQRPASGAVDIFDQPAGGRPADWFSRNGVVRTFQAVRLFRGMTVSENVEVGFAAAGIGRREARRRAAALWISSDCPIGPMHRATASTMATSDVSGSRAPWPCRPSSCCSTSRRQA
jgi:branched-chain amino acid transport system ATP-binding protein